MALIRLNGLPDIRPHQIVAVIVAVVAHSWIAYIASDAGAGHPVASPHAAENVITIQLAPQTAPGAPALSADDGASLQIAADTAAHTGESPAPDAARAQSTPAERTEPYYYRTGELTNPPVVLQDVLASQPLKLPDAKSKTVILRLLINEKGEVDQVLVEGSELTPDSTKTLVDTFSKMTFEPGKIAGSAVRSQLAIEVDASPSR